MFYSLAFTVSMFLFYTPTFGYAQVPADCLRSWTEDGAGCSDIELQGFDPAVVKKVIQMLQLGLSVCADTRGCGHLSLSVDCELPLQVKAEETVCLLHTRNGEA